MNAADPSRLPPLPRLLISSQFAFNVGFFAVLPYLAEHLSGALGLAGWLVGLVLGLRTFSQQGLFVVGGALTDRYGARPVVLAGCVLRVAGFGWLGFAGATWSVIGAVLLVGFAAALFSPAVETEIARQAVRHEEETGLPRTRMLARFSAGGQAGALIGPVLGALLLYGGFRAACLTGAAVFAVVTAAHWRLLPGRPPAGPGERGQDGREHVPVRDGVRLLLRNRAFLGLCLAYSTYLLAYNQLYLALPGELQRATGSQAALGWLFALSSVLVVAGQVPLSRWAAERLSWRGSVLGGLLLIAASFAVAGALLEAGGLWPSLAFVVLLTLGQMLVVPATRAWVPDLVGDRSLGLFTGALSSVSGLVVLAGSAPAGALLEAGGALPWLVLAAVPLAGLALVPRTARAAAPAAVPGAPVR
ncbi:MFS transporter [Streptomyces sp. Wb2n-11]|uniref:MDR family MFS transporter n=1 Tax=Streptomyces sp. Wb2n-11 TaxID=1030533 RepID=UPI000AE85D6A|nr:MFS transporter [Streptomyces sp. Wb2n-11]